MESNYRVGNILVRKITNTQFNQVEYMRDMGDYVEIINPCEPEAKHAWKETFNLENGYESEAVLIF